MALENGTLVKVDEALKQAVEYARTLRETTQQSVPMRRRRSSVNDVPASYGGSSEYMGMFKLILEQESAGEGESESTHYYVRIVDGATYNASATPFSGNSTCKVNNVVFSVAAYRSVEVTRSTIFALRFTAAIAADPSRNIEAQSARVEIVNLKEDLNMDSLPDDSTGNCYYQLGRAIANTVNGILTVRIQQDHQAVASNGIPQIFWYGVCS